MPSSHKKRKLPPIYQEKDHVRNVAKALFKSSENTYVSPDWDEPSPIENTSPQSSQSSQKTTSTSIDSASPGFDFVEAVKLKLDSDFEVLKKEADDVTDIAKMRELLSKMMNHHSTYVNSISERSNEKEIKMLRTELETVNNRLNSMMGTNDDSVAKVFERFVLKHLEQKHHRNFKLNLKLMIRSENSLPMEAEFDAVSLFCEDHNTLILAESTLSVFSIAKVQKCVLKRQQLSEYYQIPKEKIDCYIYTFRIEKSEETAILEELRKENIELIFLENML